MLGIKRFSRTTEDFKCEHCGFKVKGSGYTDHCPQCLYSKHVDINPGDRQAKCLGLMEPINVEIKGDRQVICYKCIKCGHEHRVKADENDNYDEIFKTVNKILR